MDSRVTNFQRSSGHRPWNGRAYKINLLYQQGAELKYEDEAWVFPTHSSGCRPNGPREYRQLLSTLLNGLIDSGFTLLQMHEEMAHEVMSDLVPGEWNHFTAVMPPWLSFLARFNKQTQNHQR
jgi:hypothetical protein